MSARIFSILLAGWLIGSLLLSGCGSRVDQSDTGGWPISRGHTGQIVTGPEVPVLNQNIPSGGGTITVSTAESPLAGLSLRVPAGAYSTSRRFSLSFAPVEKHSFGADFNPLTPLILIDNSGVYGGAILELKLALKIPDDMLAMGFFYDKQSGTLEGLPVLARDSTSITLGFRRCAPLIVSGIKLNELPVQADSGFRPGKDDWQFTNRGSFIALEGHATGQSLSALWYYLTQPDGPGTALWGRYDNNGIAPPTPHFALDDSRAWRLVSVLHNDLDWADSALRLQAALPRSQDRLTLKYCLYAMHLSGQPQVLGLSDQSGTQQAMICYRVEDTCLFLADPGYPADPDRKIVLDGQEFSPYLSSRDPDSPGPGLTAVFNRFTYAGCRSLIDWELFQRHWKEFKDGSIGQDRFPVCTIVYKDPQGKVHDLPDNFTADNPWLYIGVRAEMPEGIQAGVIIYRDEYREGAALPRDEAENIRLKDGPNRLGIYIAASLEDGRLAYLDFRYLTVIYRSSKG